MTDRDPRPENHAEAVRVLEGLTPEQVAAVRAAVAEGARIGSQDSIGFTPRPMYGVAAHEGKVGMLEAHHPNFVVQLAEEIGLPVGQTRTILAAALLQSTPSIQTAA